MQCRLEFNDEELSIGILDNLAKKFKALEFIRFYFREVITLTMFSVLLYTGIHVVQQNFIFGALSPVLRIPMGIYFLLMTITFGLVILLTLLNMIVPKFITVAEGEEEVVYE
jgi:TRAP-type C4-dicarboxylate transport system permease small subunit